MGSTLWRERSKESLSAFICPRRSLLPPLLQLHIVLLSLYLSYAIVTTSGQGKRFLFIGTHFQRQGFPSLFFPSLFWRRTQEDLVRSSLCGFFVFIYFYIFGLWGFWLPNRLVDHPSTQPCAIEFNQFFFSSLLLSFRCKLGVLCAVGGCLSFPCFLLFLKRDVDSILSTFYFLLIFCFFFRLLPRLDDDHQLLWRQSNQT